jgi:hypothetical protein
VSGKLQWPGGIALLALVCLSPIVSSCGSAPGSAAALAEIAVLAAEYKALDASTSLDSTEAESFSSDAAGTKAIYQPGNDATSKGTDPAATVTVELSDQGTADPTDDVVTVTRTWTRDDDAVVTSVVTRPKRPGPGPAWSAFWAGADVNGDSMQAAAEVRSIGGVRIAEITLRLYWQKDAVDSSISLVRTVRDGELVRIDSADSLRTTLTWENGVIASRRLEYFRVKEGGVAAHTVVFERIALVQGATYSYGPGSSAYSAAAGDEAWKCYETDALAAGETPTDYWIIVKGRNPRIVDYYEAGQRMLTIAKAGGNIDRIYYAADGSERKRVTGRIVVVADEATGVISVTKTFSNGRKVEVSVASTAGGYAITRNGYSYSVFFLDSSTVVISDAGGSHTFVQDAATGDWIEA